MPGTSPSWFGREPMNEEKKIPTLPGVVVERSAMIKDRLTKFAQIEDLKLTADAELSEALGRILRRVVDEELRGGA